MAALLLALLLPLGACNETELAYGDVNSIIVGASPDVWERVGDTLDAALEPTITTTMANEEVFQVSHHSPLDSSWVNLRKFRQLLLVGTPDDPWVETALARSDAGSISPPALVRAYDVWARGQTATVLVLPSDDDVEPVVERLPELRESYLERYREWALNRMFITGRDTALADTLARDFGFRMVVPNVYQWESRGDSVVILRNDNPDPAELIRQFTVTWSSPPPDSLPVTGLVEWRRALARAHYEPAHEVDTTLMSVDTVSLEGREARRFQAIWKNPPEANWPAAGNFIIQTVECPAEDRLYYVDAWLYAPGKDKFEYLFQLETILDTFRCAA
jgi:hypothetical protein